MILVLSLIGSLTFASPVAQRPARVTPPQDGAVPVKIALKAGAQSYDVAGKAQCRHAPRASIYGIAAEMWSVQHDEPGRNLSVTVWRPQGGGDNMLNLMMAVDNKRYSVNTVKGGQGSAAGTGTVTFALAGKGGTFTISATADGGAKVAGTVTCDAFTAQIAEGGNEL
jgi:hypothetical protein